jgi:hypothetical protein
MQEQVTLLGPQPTPGETPRLSALPPDLLEQVRGRRGPRLREGPRLRARQGARRAGGTRRRGTHRRQRRAGDAGVHRARAGDGRRQRGRSGRHLRHRLRGLLAADRPARVHRRHADGDPGTSCAHPAHAALGAGRPADPARSRTAGAGVPVQGSRGSTPDRPRAVAPACPGRVRRPLDRGSGACGGPLTRWPKDPSFHPPCGDPAHGSLRSQAPQCSLANYSAPCRAGSGKAVA